MDKKKIHSDSVSFIKNHPWRIGLESIALSTGESIIFRRNEIVREPDGLMFDPTTHTLYNIEYKTHHSNQNKHKAKGQLRDCHNYLRNLFYDWRIVNLYIHDNYKIEEIK